MCALPPGQTHTSIDTTALGKITKLKVVIIIIINNIYYIITKTYIYNNIIIYI